MAKFYISDSGIIVNEYGAKKYFPDFSEEELKDLPPCPFSGKRFCYFDTTENEWIFDYTHDGE